MYLREPGAYPNMTQLKLTGWDTDGLQALADTLQKADPCKPIALSLTARPAHGQQDLSCLAPLNLSSLTVANPRIGYSDPFSPGLVDAHFPITLTEVENRSDAVLTHLLQFPSLTSLDMADIFLSNRNTIAIANHPNLKHLSAEMVLSEGLTHILKNPRLESLHLMHSSLEFTEEEDLSNLTTHAALKELGRARVENEASLNALAKHPTISTLDLDLLEAAVPGTRNLANMPTLKNLVLRGDEDDNAFVFNADDLSALCARQMDAMVFQDLPLTPAATAVAASANTKTWVMRGEHFTLDTPSMNALLRNAVVDSLLFAGAVAEGIPKTAWLQLAERPNIQRLDLTFISNDVTSEEVTAAWKAAGKDERDLRCYTPPTGINMVASACPRKPSAGSSVVSN